VEDKIAGRTATVAVIGWATWGCPWPSALPGPASRSWGSTSTRPKSPPWARAAAYIQDVDSADVATVVQAGRLSASSDYDRLLHADAIFICVPTPFDAMKAPDLRCIEQAARGIAPRLKPGQLVILQSTTYPGTTKNSSCPSWRNRGCAPVRGFTWPSPPSGSIPATVITAWRTRPRSSAGSTPRCTELARALLTQLFAQVHVVSSPRAAEMSKLLENIYRSVNIALVNELALLSERMGIDLWEVIEAARTKPFGFMPFYPGPGVGGHCIPSIRTT